MNRLLIPGDHSAVRSEALRLDNVATALLAIANTLSLVANEDTTVGESVDVIRTRTEAASTAVRAVYPRYQTTSSALREYAVALEDTKKRAADASSRIDAEEDFISDSNFALMSLRSDEMDATTLTTGDGAEELRTIHLRMRELNQDIEAAQSRLATARNNYDDAFNDWHTAAQVASEKIRPVLSDLNDTFFDRFVAGIESIGEFIAGIAVWLAEVLVAIVAYAIILVTALMAIVIMLVLAIVLLSFAGILVPLLALGIIDLNQLLDLMILVTMFLLPILMPVIGLLLAVEILAPTPEVVQKKPFGGEMTDRGTKTNTAYLIENNGVIDDAGGDASTEIEITLVIDEDGNRLWRVTLPSTQDWQFDGDNGSLNDTGSNLALMMSPQQSAAYERAVLEAMSQAGIGPDEPVMLIGWSQGGILAGKLASNPTLPYNIEAIVVAGSPIDHMNIPQTGDRAVSVLSIQHEGDMVHRLDGVAGRTDEHWATVTVPPPPDQPAHGNESYAITAAEVDGYANNHIAAVRDEQDKFFSDNELNYRYSASEEDISVIQ